jgi:dTDP-4-dehydrorhamnose reductase
MGPEHPDMDHPELWGGIECTLNRVGDSYRSQLVWNGHLCRAGDLDLIAELGIRTLRYPVLWEMVAPNSLDDPDWSWTDRQLERLRALDITPIVGLLHHGSGPRYTSLLDPEFPAKLARYARLVAQRYPWVKAFTPVNEPLTTARFSALYGHWYPHAREDRAFARALILQCRGIAAAMTAIREIIPDARLVVTEDLGLTRSTEQLRYQAEFENQRRWLSFDLLFGRVTPDHPLRRWLEGAGGVPCCEFDSFLKTPVVPALIGINYYLTSDRFLDHRLERYPDSLHGGNGRERYADVEAVRACPKGIAGHEALLRQAWQRYRTEVAITEVHLGATREEQLRWFREAWQSGVSLRREGVPVRAITAWALLGSFGWDSLCTSDGGLYEPGAFDVRGPKPRPTAIASVLKTLAHGGDLEGRNLDHPGWWRRDVRFLESCRPVRHRPVSLENCSEAGGMIITGRTGTLGQAFARLCEERGLPYHLLSRGELDIASPESVRDALRRFRPWAVVNSAGFVRIDDAEIDCAGCFRENTTGPAVLAAECRHRGVALLTFSSDMVFNGTKGSAYHEGDPVSPVNIYGQSKAEAERKVLTIYPESLVVRSSAFFGPWDQYNFVTATLTRLARGEEVAAASDLYVSPTYIPDLVHASLDLLLDGECGIWHVSNSGSVSWSEFACAFAVLAGMDPAAVLPRPAATFGYPARRPSYLELSSVRGGLLSSLDDALRRYFCQMGGSPRWLGAGP